MEIFEFIENFRCCLGLFTKKESEIIQQLFENGYCYYFAKILKDVFPGGELCIPWPIGHFVYKYNDKYWDISGEYIPKQHDCAVMIPLNREYFIDDCFIRHIEKTFMHNGYSKNEYVFRKIPTQKSKDPNNMNVKATDIVLRYHEFKMVPIVKYYDKEISLLFDNDPMNKCKFIKDRIYEIVPYINLAISSDRLEEIIEFFIEKNVISKDIIDNSGEVIDCQHKKK